MEAGTSLPGPLSAYACPVYLDTVHLDPRTGEPLSAAATAAATASTSTAAAATAQKKHRLEGQIPHLRQSSRQVQAALLQALQPFGYRLEALRLAVTQQVGCPSSVCFLVSRPSLVLSPTYALRTF